MRLSMLMSFWLLGLGGAGGLMGVALAQAASSDPTVSLPVGGGMLHLNPSSLTFPVAFVVVGWMAIRSLPSLLKDWEPSVRIEHIHILQGTIDDTISRRELEEALSSLRRDKKG